MYTPDKWLVIKINSDTPLYKIFACWSGGYLDGDSWKLNSGIVKVEEDEDCFLFHGYSGSIYKCRKSCYGINAYGSAVLKGFQEQAKSVNVDILVVPEDTDWLKQDWLIK